MAFTGVQPLQNNLTLSQPQQSVTGTSPITIGGPIAGLSGMDGKPVYNSIPGTTAENYNTIPATDTWGIGENYSNTTPVAPPAPVYRDQYGNVRNSQAEADEINQFANSTNTSVGNLRDTNNRAWGNTQTDYNQRGDSLYNTHNATQNTINTNRGNNALNLRRSMSAIANGVRQGLRSGGVNLANMNALDSGAAEAMARAFAKSGTGQVGDARNQAASANRLLDNDQNTLGAAIATDTRNLSAYGRGAVADSQNTWGQNLNVLRTSADGKQLGHLVDTNQDDVWATDATNWLLQQDAGLSGRMSGIQGWGQDKIDQTAYEWDMAGRDVGTNPFGYLGVDQGAQQIGGGNGGLGAGAPVTQIPLFTRRDEQRLV